LWEIRFAKIAVIGAVLRQTLWAARCALRIRIESVFSCIDAIDDSRRAVRMEDQT
jgi:hypothetical protein